jgi:GNAT superfamily N-acetyltransferase
MNILRLQPAFIEDIPDIWKIILQAKELMRLRNSIQWQDGYPARENIVADIDHGYGYILSYRNRIVAYAAVIFDGEPAYNQLIGKWIGYPPYVVVHRLAVAGEVRQQGVATHFVGQIEALARARRVHSFRVDTNFDNIYMKQLLLRQGFTYCGDVFYTINRRMAFEKII